MFSISLPQVCIMSQLSWYSPDYLPVVTCMESADDPVESAAGCVRDLSRLDFASVSACAAGPEGNRLLHRMGNRTEGLEPPHEYVPWIVVDQVKRRRVMILMMMMTILMIMMMILMIMILMMMVMILMMLVVDQVHNDQVQRMAQNDLLGLVCSKYQVREDDIRELTVTRTIVLVLIRNNS